MTWHPALPAVAAALFTAAFTTWKRESLACCGSHCSGRENLLREQPSPWYNPLDFVLAVGPKSRYSGPHIRMALWLYRKLGPSPLSSIPALILCDRIPAPIP